MEVLRLVAAGRGNRVIASVHVSNILAKLGVSTRTEAAATRPPAVRPRRPVTSAA